MLLLEEFIFLFFGEAHVVIEFPDASCGAGIMNNAPSVEENDHPFFERRPSGNDRSRRQIRHAAPASASPRDFARGNRADGHSATASSVAAASGARDVTRRTPVWTSAGLPGTMMTCSGARRTGTASGRHVRRLNGGRLFSGNRPLRRCGH